MVRQCRKRKTARVDVRRRVGDDSFCGGRGADATCLYARVVCACCARDECLLKPQRAAGCRRRLCGLCGGDAAVSAYRDSAAELR